MTIGFAICGSFCTYSRVFPVLDKLAGNYDVIPFFSDFSSHASTRFGDCAAFLQTAARICGHEPILTIDQAEPIGPRKLLEALVIAPCTGNTLAKLAHGIADTTVTMAAKSHLRNNRPVVIAVSTNDALTGAAENIGRLLVRKHYYFVPFGQDAPEEKPNSMVADFSRIPDTLSAALEGRQLQPILVCG